MPLNNFDHVVGKYFEPAANDSVVGATEDPQILLLVHLGEIGGADPVDPIAKVLGAQFKYAFLAKGEWLTRLRVDDPSINPSQHLANAAAALLAGFEEFGKCPPGNAAGEFSCSVILQDRDAEMVLKLVGKVRVEWRGRSAKRDETR